MKPTIENMLIAVQSPEMYMEDFKSALAREQNVSVEILKVAKTFAGDAFATEAKVMTGKSSVEFTNLANGKNLFPEAEHFLVGFIKLYEGVDAVLDDTDWVSGITNSELKNATMDVSKSGLRILKDIPLSTFTPSAEQNDSGYLVLTVPVWWIAQTSLEITIKFPKEVVTPTLNLKIELSGSKFIS